METKYVFLDIDGTLAMPGTTVSEETLSAINRAQTNGHYVFLNTGRSEKDIPDHIAVIDFDGIVCSAGARIIVDDKVIKNSFISQEDLNYLLDILNDLNIDYILESTENNFSKKTRNINLSLEDRDKASSELLRAAVDEEDEEYADLKQPLEISEYNNEPVYKVNFRIFNNPDKTKKELMDHLDKKFSICFFDNLFPGIDFCVGEITYKEFNKGDAIVEVCSYLKGDVKDSISFGDSMNDESMIRKAGIGVVMDNATDQMKEMADVVCESCEENGVAKEFERLGLLSPR